MKRWTLWALLLLTLVVSACGGGSGTQTVSVTISPTTATVRLRAAQQFTAAVTGATNTSVTWSVNAVAGGNSTVGTISTLGLYTAPAIAPTPSSVTVTATSVADASKSASATVTIDTGATVTVSPSSVTLAAGETQQFTATVTNSSNTAVTWQVNGVTGGNTTTGTITDTGLYTAPTGLVTTLTATVTAVLRADSTRTGTANVTVVPQGPAALSSISPSTVAQGSLFQDVYLTGSGFLTTSVARANGAPVPTTFVNTSTLRARAPMSFFSSAGSLLFDVQQQAGGISGGLQMNVVPVRPAFIGTTPDSAQQGGGSVSVNFEGGYYSPSVTAQFGGQPRGATLLDSRQLSVAVTSQDLSSAGLFPVSVRNSAIPDQIAAMNLAVEPSGPPLVLTTLGVGDSPNDVAINTATGIAVVANQNSNSISILDLNTNTVSGAPLAVGTGPTGVAIDNLRNVAVVVNNGSNTLSIVDLAVSPPAVATTVSTGVQAAPYAVGVDPLRGLAVVVFQNSPTAMILDLATNTVRSITRIPTTGTTPQVAIDSRLGWAIVTPGGTGLLSVVSLTGLGTTAVASIAAASSNGAVRTSNTVTITTTTSHNLSVGQQVTISGVADASFNGTFRIATVPAATTFTYSQTGADATSGGGTVSAAGPLVTVALSQTITGIGLNAETKQALLVDPVSNSATIFSTLDQTVTTFTLEPGTTGAAVNPLTNIGVAVNPTLNQASVISLRVPGRLATVNVGTAPQTAAIDPTTDEAVVVNKGSNNVTLIQLGALRSLQVTEISPATTLTSPSDLVLTLVGHGFAAGSLVRLNETPIASTMLSERKLTATIPAALLAQPRRFVVDVENPGGDVSNANDFAVVQAIPVGTAPSAVAIDPNRDLAVVPNAGDNTASVIDLNSGSVVATLAVGTNPQGVAVLPRAGRAVVTNEDSGTATVLDLSTLTASTTVTVGTQPIGVAINPATGQAVVANNGGNSLSFFDVSNPGTPSSLNVDQGPLAIAVDPTRGIAAVTHRVQNNVVIVNLSTQSIRDRLTGFQLPTGVTFDPDSDRFLVVSSLANNLVILNPDTLESSAVRVGINPTSLDYNFQTGTLVTVNTASQTVSVMDFENQRVRAILPLAGSSRFAVAIHPRTNVAAIADTANNRLLLVPLPR